MSEPFPNLTGVLTSNISDGVLLLNEKLELDYLNAPASKLLNINLEESRGSRIGALTIPKEIKEWLSLSSGEVSDRSTLSWNSASGEEKKLTLLKIKDQERRMLLLIIAKSSSAEVKKTLDPPELLQRERSRREFLGILAHDLRSPLHKIMLSTEILRDSATNEERRDQFLGTIERSSRSMLELLNDMLSLIRIEAGELRIDQAQVNLKPFFREIMASQREIAESRSITLTLEEIPLEQFSFDGRRIRQVVLNLLDNALKFSPANSTIIVRALLRNQRFRCEIEDHGPGISDAVQQRIFRPFSRGDTQPIGKDQTSTGLGLAICKKIIDLHHGQIGVESDGMTGSTFWFELPAVAA